MPLESDSTLQCVLVMPVYNEEGCIAAVVRSWIDALDAATGASFSMIVVDDGSKDRTGSLLDELARTDKRLIVVHQQNAGHGAALMNGFKQAVAMKSDYVFQTDSDDQFDPSDFQRLWAVRMKSKFILGFRETRYDPLHRLVITRILRFLAAAAFGVWIKDANVPYRLMRTTYLNAMIEILPPGLFAPNVFLSVLAARDGQDLMHIPVSHRDRRTGKISIVRWKLIRVCIRTAHELFTFRANLGTAISSLRELDARYSLQKQRQS